MSVQPFFSRYFGLEEPMCDADGLYSGCPVAPPQAKIIYWISWLSAVTGVVGIYYGFKWLGFFTIIGSIIAQLYWSHPTYSSRRTIDIISVQALLWSHMWFAFGTPIFILYAAIQLLGTLAYAVSWVLDKQGSTWAATFSHVVVHICTNISLLLLYTAS